MTTAQPLPARTRPSAIRLTLAVLALWPLGLIGCDRSDSAGPTATPAANPPSAGAAGPAKPRRAVVDYSGPPTIEFDRTNHHFGEVSDTDVLVCEFSFTNTGGERLVVQQVKTSCGCAVPELKKKQFEPGEGDSVVVTFKPGREGYQTQEVTIITNDEASPITRLRIAADVRRFIDFDIPVVNFKGVEESREHQQRVIVTCRDPKARLQQVRSTSPHLAGMPVRGDDALGLQPGQVAIDVVLRRSAPWGHFDEQIAVIMRGRPTPESDEIEHNGVLRVIGDVYGQVTLEPARFLMGVEQGDSFERIIKLRHRENIPFSITGTEIRMSTLDTLEVTWEPWDEQGLTGVNLILTGTGDAPPGHEIHARVAYTTDVPGEPEREIQVLGVVR